MTCIKCATYIIAVGLLSHRRQILSWEVGTISTDAHSGCVRGGKCCKSFAGSGCIRGGAMGGDCCDCSASMCGGCSTLA